MLNVMLDLLITLEIYIICHLYWYTVHYIKKQYIS